MSVMAKKAKWHVTGTEIKCQLQTGKRENELDLLLSNMNLKSWSQWHTFCNKALILISTASTNRAIRDHVFKYMNLGLGGFLI